MFDRDHDGILNRSDIIYMTTCLIEVAQFVYVPDIHINTSPEIYADQILSSNTSTLAPADFLIWCQKDRLLIELLDLIFQTCHVVLGLKPSSQQDEVTIVKYVIKIRKRTHTFSFPDIFFVVRNIHFCILLFQWPYALWYSELGSRFDDESQENRFLYIGSQILSRCASPPKPGRAISRGKPEAGVDGTHL